MKNVQDLLKRAGNPPEAIPTASEAVGNDHLDDELEKALTRLNSALDDYPRSIHNTANNTVRTDGWIVGLAVAAIVLTLYSAISTQISINDLRAWKDVHSNDIIMMRAKLEQLQERQK